MISRVERPSDDSEIYYVGATKNPIKRWAAYRGAHSSGQRVNTKHKELKRLKLKPVMVALATVPSMAIAATLERIYSEWARISGYKLLSGSAVYVPYRAR